MPTQKPPRLDPARTAFFLDFDGTLVPFNKPDVNTPLVDEALRSLLNELRTAAGGALAVISGRTIDAIDGLFEPLLLAASGEHGAEWRLQPDALRETVALPGGLDIAQQHCEAFVKANPGARFERKPFSMVIHFHDYPELREAAAAAASLGCVANSGIKMLHARGMVEVKTEASNKGYAVARFMTAAPYAGRQPVFIGDDVTDEDGFMAVNALGGISVKVGPGASHARFRLPDEDSVREWLEAMVDATDSIPD